MATLQISNIDDDLYNQLKEKAMKDNRSINQEVILILENYLSDAAAEANARTTREFLKITWEDDRTAEEIIDDIRNSRVEKDYTGMFDGVFD